MKSNSLISPLCFLIIVTFASRIYPQCPAVRTCTGEGNGLQFSYSVASAGDVNGDGYDDVIVGSLFGEKAYVFSGRTGDSIYVFTGEEPDDQFGSSVASAGDVNRDGYDDLIVGAPYNEAGGFSAGRAYVYSGMTGATIGVFTGDGSGKYFGFSVASAGDVNGDGYDDLVVGTPFNNSGGNSAGRAYVYSGLTGNLIHVFTGDVLGGSLGHSVASAGDGFDDLIVGAAGYNFGLGRTYLFSGGSLCCGDPNGDGEVNLNDVLFLQSYYLNCGAPVNSLWGSDVNCDGLVNIADITYLNDFLNGAGPAPCCQ